MSPQGNEQVLTAALPYQAGPFGDFYLPNTTPLYGAGGDTPANLGLYHYTTRVDQVKEGEDSGKVNANIGLHYIAATNGVPIDTDGDGIPDYVENWHGDGNYSAHTDTETDWQNPMTDGVTPDPYSTIYDNIDLDGDGLTGAAERILGTNPLLSDNPLDFSHITLPSQLSGVVTIPLNINTNVDTNTMIVLNVDDSTADTSVCQSNGTWYAKWDSTEVANGIHQLAFSIQLDEDSDPMAMGVKFANIQNAICFPNDFPVAGATMYIPAQTIYTNGTWTMDVYDDQTNLFASLEGNVDGNGFCLDPNTGQPGITLSLLDTNGNQLPSKFYTYEISTFAAAIGSYAETKTEGNGGASPQDGGSGSANATGRKYIEFPWTGNGKWSIGFMPVYGSYTDSGVTLYGLMVDVVGIIQNSRYGNNSVVESPYAETPQPFRIRYLADWAQIKGDLHDTGVRNFFYFGHGGPDEIGGTTDTNYNVNEDWLQSALQNAPDPLTGINFHPYRFVFLDGCNTANGNLPVDFGIPKKQMASTNMTAQYGIPARAFLGWKSKTAKDVKGALPATHQNFVSQFFTLWPTVNPNTSSVYKLQDALDEAAKPVPPPPGEPGMGISGSDLNKRIVIYGCPDLLFGP
jgi:hypothetical protein